MVVDAVQQMGKGLFMVVAEVDEAGIGGQGEWLFVESEIFCLHMIGYRVCTTGM